MKTWLITISAYAPYERKKEYRIEASAIHVALARAMKEYKKMLGRIKVDGTIHIAVVPQGIKGIE